MSLDDDIRIIASAELFRKLEDDQLRLLAFGAERLQYTEGRNIFYEGDRAEAGFIVVSGEIALTRKIDGDEKIVKIVEPGSVLGEMAMLTETKRLTNAIAQADSTLIRINRSIFRRMLTEYPEAAAAIHDDIKARLQSFLDQIGGLEKRFGRSRDI